ncbi:hypothetical protein [Streptomyces sp. NPDC059092]|uniref:hypothetical protein n=1 Tax=Streptomyces sp. NPDC059092 TaxID=3346725 RepID=UPI0036B04092
MKKKPGLEDEVHVYVDDAGNIAGSPIRLETGWASEKSVQAAVDAVNTDPKLRADLLTKVKAAQEHMLDHNWGNKKNRGACEVEGPILRRPEAWAEEVSA